MVQACSLQKPDHPDSSSRKGLGISFDPKEFVRIFPAQDCDVPQDFNLMNNFLRATPRKLVVHVPMHEIRHWAQIGTLFRLNGLTGEFHDFLFSPVLGGEFKWLTS